jgi:hypothetical protein
MEELIAAHKLAEKRIKEKKGKTNIPDKNKYS